jgi:uncharacterized damage-inducible protein DinB
MDPKEFFLKHWQAEAKATREVIGRIPEDRSNYRADPKARTALELAWLIVREEAILVDGFERGALEWSEVSPPAKVSEIIGKYDGAHDAITKRLQAIPVARWEEKLPMMFNGQEVMRETGSEMAWGFLLDQIHHRGQLSTYLRPMGAKVPAIYGPSADES